MTVIKTIWTIIRWIWGVTMCLASIGGFASGEFIAAFFTLAFGLILLPPVTKALFKKKNIENYSQQFSNEQINPISSETQPSSDKLVNVTSRTVGSNKTEMTIELNENKIVELLKQKQQQRESEIKNFNYVPMQIQRQGIQLLESINILNTTKSLDTLIGRYDFIQKMYDDFVKASYNSRYISDIQRAIDEYKTMYYDRIIKDFELQLLVHPNHENLKEYYSLCLFNCFEGFYNEQIEQIGALKKDDAKQRRKEKIIEVGNQTISEFDKNDSDGEKFKSHLNALKEKLANLDSVNKSTTVNAQQKSITVGTSVVINKNSSFEITLYNGDQNIIQKVTSILKDENTWNKAPKLLPLFSLHDIRCKEVDEYILTYKPIYQDKLQKRLVNSTEYQNASDKDREHIEDEFKYEVIDELPERADCDLVILFDNSDIDVSIDNEFVKKYGYEVISKYFGLSHYKDKIATHWERKDFEDLIKADLVYTADELSKDEVLNSQTLKTLNLICEKEDGFFKRKNKAIEYINENKELLKNIGKHITTRNLFKLKPLPNEFSDLNINDIEKYWMFLSEYVKLIADTFQNSERNYEERNRDNSWIKGFTIEKAEDYNSNFICLRAREECKKKFSKSNPPKLPFHVGCNCHLRTQI